VDVLIGVDPREWDIVETKRLLGDRVCLWGGVNGHLTVEQGSEDEVRNEVREAMRVLAPGGGFILSPVDNVRRDTEVARANVALLIDEWRRLTGQGTTGL
jgi:uroporphyrinogen decarboxylase